MLVRFLVLKLLFQALSRYSKILVYTCISTIFCSRTQLLVVQLLVVQVVWFLLQFLCLRCIARSAYVVKQFPLLINSAELLFVHSCKLIFEALGHLIGTCVLIV